MSEKKRDNNNRWRNKTVAFRMSLEEAQQLDAMVRLSGLQKQEYLICRALERPVVVNGNPRVFKALRNQFEAVLAELRVVEPLLFFESLCRNLSNAPADCRWFTDLLRGPITLQAKDVIAQYLAQNGGLACLGGSLLTISQQIEQRLTPVFAAYGVALLGFQLNDLSPAPENKNLERLQEAYTERAAYRIRGGQDDNG